MEHNSKSIRPFIGAKDYEVSRQFYKDLGFEETVLTPQLSVFKTDGLAFYLQDAFVRDWVDNTMIFLEVEDVNRFWNDLQALGLPEKYDGVRFVPTREEAWGRECFIHDPSGILWHVGEFTR